MTLAAVGPAPRQYMIDKVLNSLIQLGAQIGVRSRSGIRRREDLVNNTKTGWLG